MSVRFAATSFGPGSLVRFKQKKSHPWTYGIYRGTEKEGDLLVCYTFSDYPLDVITRRLYYWPDIIEAATST
jgi:hypothetical protein